jgi:tetratricopeptide (TPR) repeat protein
MLKPKRKITKKEIKQDALITTYGKVTSYYDQNKKYINYAFTALVVIVIGTIIYINNHRTNNVKAATELGKVFSIYDAAANDPRQYTTAVEGQPERGIMGLRAIVDNYGSTVSGELARFYLANAYLHLGKYDDALKQFGSFSSSSDLLTASALAGIGACCEAKSDYATAAKRYEKAANAISDPSVTPDYLNSAARCYGMSGEKERAIELLKRIKKEFPKSAVAREVDRYISQFSV